MQKAIRKRLAPDDPRRLWPNVQRNRLNICPVCDEIFYMINPREWAYKICKGNKEYKTCSYSCMSKLAKKMLKQKKHNDPQKQQKEIKYRKKPIIVLDRNFNRECIYENATQAQSITGIQRHLINKRCVYNRKVYGNNAYRIKHIFMYLEDWEALNHDQQNGANGTQPCSGR